MRLLQHVASRIVGRRGLPPRTRPVWQVDRAYVAALRLQCCTYTRSAWRQMAARGGRGWSLPAAAVPLAILCYMHPATVRCDAGQSLLAAIRSGDRAAVVAAVGALVRQLDKEGFDGFAKEGGLQQLASELHSAVVTNKINAVKALRALVKYGMVPFVERSGVVDGLVACTASAMTNQEPELCYEAVRLLERLAQEETLHRYLVKSGALAPLTAAANSSSPQTRSYAARALVHLATTSDEKAGVIHRRLVDAGSYTALVHQVADSHPGVTAHAAKAVGEILKQGGEPAKQVLALDAATALVGLLAPLSEGSNKESAQPSTAAAVGALAALGGNLPEMIGLDGCQLLCTAAGTLLFDKGSENNLSATEALAEVATLQSLEDIVAEDRENRSLAVCDLLSCADARVRTSAARCLANLSLHPEYAQVLGRRDTIGPLLHSLAPHVEVSTRQEASRAVSNLAANPLCRVILMREGALNAAVAILVQANGLESKLASYALKTVTLFAQNQFPEATPKLINRKTIKALVQCAASKDKQRQRNAVVSLAAISSHPDSHHLLVAGEYPAHWVIAKTCLDPSWPVAPDTQRYAVMTLANLAADEQYRQQLQQIGVANACRRLKDAGDELVKGLVFQLERNLKAGGSATMFWFL